MTGSALDVLSALCVTNRDSPSEPDDPWGFRRGEKFVWVTTPHDALSATDHRRHKSNISISDPATDCPEEILAFARTVFPDQENDSVTYGKPHHQAKVT